MFSCKGIKLAVDYFLQRGHVVEAFVPRFRRGNSENPEYLDELEEAGILKYCPNKTYDDKFMVKTAIYHKGVIISNDQYRDLIDEFKDLRKIM